jgi:excisionase family DNA binding protein
MNERLYTIKEVIEVLKVSQATVYRMMYSGRLPRVKIGKSVRIPVSAVEAVIKENTQSIMVKAKDEE